MDIVKHRLAIYDIEIGVLVVAIIHLPFLQEIGGTVVKRLHTVEMALILEGLFPSLVIVCVLHVNGYQGHIILSVGGQIDRHRSGKVVVTGRQIELVPRTETESNDTLCSLKANHTISVRVIIRAGVIKLKGMVKPEVVAPLTILVVGCPAVAGIDGSRCTYQCKEKREVLFHCLFKIFVVSLQSI